MNRLFIVPFSFSLLFAEGQTEVLVSVEHETEEIKVVPGDSIVALQHRFVIEGSVRARGAGSQTIIFDLANVEGTLRLYEPPRDTLFLTVDYDYFSGEFPAFVGLQTRSLPTLEIGGMSGEKTPTEKELKGKSPKLPVVADGQFSRSIGFSPGTGMLMNGGLQLNLQGRLSKEMSVSGILSDQNSPIQPEGDTRSLNEIDKVFVEVTYPSGLIQAGDVDISLQKGRYQHHERRIEGLSFSSSGNRGDMAFMLGSARGKYRTMEFRGEDQNQGPYPLVSENGSRRIMITAGSEKVWLDGKGLERGESADYTIDYSQSEFTFTPKRLIDANSRITIEYEYSDFGFQRRVSAASASRRFADGRGSFSLNWVREADDISSQSLIPESSEERLTLAATSAGSVKRSLAVPDSSGDYMLSLNPDEDGDSIFVYVEVNSENEVERYTVGFHNAGEMGLYARQVTTEGRLYFVYVPKLERSKQTDLYVPWKKVTAPQIQQVANFTVGFDLSENTSISFEMAGSGMNPNRLAQSVHHSGGLAAELSLTHAERLPGTLGAVTLKVETRGSGDSFRALQRESQIEFWREWNLDRDRWESTRTNGIQRQVSQLSLSHELPRAGTSSLIIGKYSDGGQESHQKRWASRYSNKFFNLLSLELNNVERSSMIQNVSDSQWRRGSIFASLFSGTIHPYFRHEEEIRTGDMKFNESGTGIQLQRKLMSGNIGIVHRNDFIGDYYSEDWRREGESWLGEIDLKARPTKSVNATLILKQRFKVLNDGRDDLNYRLARGSARYSPRRGNTRASLNFRLERSLYEEKIVVYDSVAYGMGQYRYDSATGLYSEDPAGRYVAFHLPSGNRSPATRFVGGLRLHRRFRDFSESFLRDLTWRFIGSVDYTGSEATYRSVMLADLDDPGLKRSRLSGQTELRFTPGQGRRRVGLKGKGSRDVISQSIQESRDRLRREISLNWEEPLNDAFILVVDVSRSAVNHESSISSRKRSTDGWYSQSGLRWRRDRSFQVGGDLVLGGGKGSSVLGAHDVELRGIELETLLFPGKLGRIDGSVGMIKVAPGGSGPVVLPPEAARGLQPGTNLKASAMAMLNLTEALTLNLNVTYLYDAIHDNFLLFTGELRASF
ncbi:MAG: hypothetical protein VX822_02375 [Candidatus Neomarinimicrobiota bacterium]|nr:hypothetical protein [Candidatus Neomarinimicrobiota bacterium]